MSVLKKEFSGDLAIQAIRAMDQNDMGAVLKTLHSMDKAGLLRFRRLCLLLADRISQVIDIRGDAEHPQRG